MTAASSIWHLSTDGASDRRELVVRIPIRTVSETNQREHWRQRHRRRKHQRQTVYLVVSGLLSAEGVKAPCAVHLTRVAPSNGLDSDNLLSSLKAVRDGIADALGVDDRDPRVTWAYDQRRGKVREWAVEVRVVSVGPGCPAARQPAREPAAQTEPRQRRSPARPRVQSR